MGTSGSYKEGEPLSRIRIGFLAALTALGTLLPVIPASGAPAPHGECDFDGDGYGDVVFAAPGRAVGASAVAGEVYAVYGGAGGLTRRTQAWNQDTPGVIGRTDSFGLFGNALACGDFNGDGFSDLAVGAPLDHVRGIGTGSVTVFSGSAAGLSSEADEFWHRGRSRVPGGAQDGDLFGSTLEAGDFNGDGFDDLAIASLTDGSGPSNSGEVVVLDGSASGLTAANAWAIHQGASSPGEAETVTGRPATDELFGVALAAHDFDRDGYDELVIAVPGEAVRGQPEAGQIHLLAGSANGVISQDTVINLRTPGVLGKPVADAWFGYHLSVGDFNGDGRGDLAVGAPGATRKSGRGGQVHVFYGDGDGLSTDNDQVWHQNRAGIGEKIEDDDMFGWKLIALDYNGDGYDDLAVGAPGESRRNKTAVGQAHVIFGAAAGLDVATPSLTIRQHAIQGSLTEPEDRFGAELGAADVNGDGFTDLLAGTFREDIRGVMGTGRVDAVLGNADAVISSDGRWWAIGREGIPGPRRDNDWFGRRVAG